jgi:hypothetical protein
MKVPVSMWTELKLRESALVLLRHVVLVANDSPIPPGLGLPGANAGCSAESGWPCKHDFAAVCRTILADLFSQTRVQFEPVSSSAFVGESAATLALVNFTPRGCRM